jgi:ribose 5-phosphate isomerase B
MKVLVGADFAGFDLKEVIKSYLIEKDLQVEDVGMFRPEEEIPYYEVAAKAAKKIQKGEADKAILFCGTGMGVSIVANKFKGVYASVVESEFGAQHARVINDSNVLTMGGFVISEYRAKRIADLWLDSKFTEGYEHIGEFLSCALDEIKTIEDETMK